MVATWRRIAIGVGFALCGLLLTGCRAEGTIDILSEERVAVNLMVTSPDVDCPEAVDGLLLHITAATDASGLRTCHVFGESQAITLDQFGINLSTAAEYLVLQTNLSLGIDDLPACDIQIRFPGQVVTATKGTILGNAVHITDLRPLAQGSGMRVIGLGLPGPPAWMMAAAIGTGSGVVGTLLILGMVWLARRRRPPEPKLIPLEPAEPTGIAEGPPIASGSNGQVAASSLVPTGGSPAAVVDESTENAWFAAPSPAPPVTPDTPETASSLESAAADGLPAAPAIVEPPNHAMWAPPQD